MSNHVRRQIREAVATAVTGLTTTGSSVFQSRVYPLQTTELPCLIVTTDGDRVQPQTPHHPYTQARETQVRIEAHAMATADLDDTLDLICKEVEIAIANATGIAQGLLLQGTKIEMDALSEQPTGIATLIYTKDIYTLSNAPDVVL